MVSEKNINLFEKSVKPYFYPDSKCYITYTQNNESSGETEFSILGPDQVKEKFGFELLCGDLKKIANEQDECFEWAVNDVFLGSLNGVPSYSINENTLNSFILYQVSAKVGFGVFAAVPIERGVIVEEYLGARVKHSFFNDPTYLFLVGYDGNDVDAKYYGNIVRFFNHCPSSHPNEQVLTANVRGVGCTDKNLNTKIFFMALRDIKASEPICFDYGDLYGFGDDVVLFDAQTYLPIGDSVKSMDEF